MLRELVDDDISAIKNNLAKLTASKDAFVQADDYDRRHLVTVGPPAAPIKWRTHCGWRFAASRYQVVDDVIAERCGLCFRKVHTHKP